jgi:hypothetical protein
VFLVIEREVLVQEVADHAAKEIVGCRGNPVAKMETVVEHKHDGSPNYRIDYSHHDKLHECLVGEQCCLAFD